MQNKLFLQAIKATVPVFFGYISIGIPFGLLIVQAGYPWYFSPLMGLFMFTGSGQYFAVGLFASGAGLGVIVLAEFLLSIRHFFYGLALIQKYKDTKGFKPYLIFAITDETFAVVSNLRLSDELYTQTEKAKLYFYISLLDQCYWLTGSIIGAVAYTILEKYNLAQYLQGIDFALTALFIVILIEQIKSRKDIISPVIGIAAGIISIVLYRFGIFDSSNILWVAICIGLGVMLLFREPGFFKKTEALMSEGENQKLSEEINSSVQNEDSAGESK